ncbi:lysophospholipid acyltransferase family protein [Actinoalloteichus hymeniacidonis]|uniref:1-acyl-sn-glycerol-3-phosphate acyltransferase n=1 Tax=Actinoalloteichus hymeniacidonis TaxID=340345 RepID=A0AAC9HUD3_9PSEU|nr:lysophospholipid acyltransferase family protein [Actinoalloteichus hymeniacidonis]AOS65306.1 1-acyl-sn-glycerol-3-phosphate acyltransferase [Actinoalloteichus hymeniacidonis]MBB5906609.1 1-acyl-sn-glycerol-3-phosphate acyltransferase [Actinoalloteichus hymeniacidonis]
MTSNDAERTASVPRRRERGGFWVGFAASVFHPFSMMAGRRSLENRERIPATGGALLVFNHISEIDPVYDAVVVHSAKRVPRFMAKHSLWKIPVVGTLLRSSGQIPVYRGSGEAQQSLDAALQALRSGKIVVIFPEGTVTRDPELWPMQSRTGVARLALDAEVPVIPAVNWGTQHVFDYHKRKFRPFGRKQIRVRLGEPLDLTAYADRRRDAPLLREVTDVVMGSVRDLLAEVRQEPAPTSFYVNRGRVRPEHGDLDRSESERDTNPGSS